MNKKFTSVLAAAMFLTALTACGTSEDDSVAEPAAAVTTTTTAVSTEMQAAETTAAPAAEDPAAAEQPAGAAISYDYVLSGSTIVPGAESEAVLAALGTPDSTFEAPSCAFTGTSYYYTYGGVQVVTYPDEHDQTLNRFYEVDLMDATVSTPEGIKVGDTYDDLVAKYGKPTQETPAFAMYKTEGKAVQFFLEGNNITQIVYVVQFN